MHWHYQHFEDTDHQTVPVRSFAYGLEYVFMNVAAYPYSANACDSLAEEYLKEGDTDNSRLNYRRALELNSENKNAKAMLKKLEAQ